MLEPSRTAQLLDSCSAHIHLYLLRHFLAKNLPWATARSKASRRIQAGKCVQGRHHSTDVRAGGGPQGKHRSHEESRKVSVEDTSLSIPVSGSRHGGAGK